LGNELRQPDVPLVSHQRQYRLFSQDAVKDATPIPTVTLKIPHRSKGPFLYSYDAMDIVYHLNFPATETVRIPDEG
jgi:hypothetical protein